MTKSTRIQTPITLSILLIKSFYIIRFSSRLHLLSRHYYVYTQIVYYVCIWKCSIKSQEICIFLHCFVDKLEKIKSFCSHFSVSVVRYTFVYLLIYHKLFTSNIWFVHIVRQLSLTIQCHWILCRLLPWSVSEKNGLEAYFLESKLLSEYLFPLLWTTYNSSSLDLPLVFFLSRFSLFLFLPFFSSFPLSSSFSLALFLVVIFSLRVSFLFKLLSICGLLKNFNAIPIYFSASIIVFSRICSLISNDLNKFR